MIESSLNAIPLGQRKSAIPHGQRGESWRESTAMEDYEQPSRLNPRKYTIPNVLMDNNGPSVNKFVIENIYMSRQCRRQTHPNYTAVNPPVNLVPDNIKNPHNAYQDGKRFHFDFSPHWYNENTLNKAIALRRIETRPRAYNFKLNWRYQRNAEDPINFSTLNHITPDDDIETALGRIATTFNRALLENTRNLPNPTEHTQMYYTYDEDAYTAELTCTTTTMFDTNEYALDLTFPYPFGDTNEFIDFNRLMNIPIDIMPDDYVKHVNTVNTAAWRFTNVWNRRDLYIHASFVNYTAYQYLGRSGEFYMKPSKIYDFNLQPIGFYFEVSFDGMNTVELLHENFIVELTLILDSKRYQSQ
jgi:hypothetical protein